jgi:hypothetical protein
MVGAINATAAIPIKRKASVRLMSIGILPKPHSSRAGIFGKKRRIPRLSSERSSG